MRAPRSPVMAMAKGLALAGVMLGRLRLSAHEPTLPIQHRHLFRDRHVSIASERMESGSQRVTYAVAANEHVNRVATVEFWVHRDTEYTFRG